MATTDTIEARLQEWGAWFNTGGALQGAWPKKNILHPSWLPPCGGGTPTPAVATRQDTRERTVHMAIGCLSDKLIACVVLRYAKRMSAQQQATELQCSVQAIDTRHKRIRDQIAAIIL